ncbi:dienelactone hydrolase family protein [Sorangium sp. So ce1128]
MAPTFADSGREQEIQISLGRTTLDGSLAVPPGATGAVLFAHGSGSSRHSPRNRHVAGVLRESGLATFLLDLLTPEEETIDDRTGHLRFDIRFLAGRLVAATDWLLQVGGLRHLRVGYFGASTGAGAALVAAAERPGVVHAVVSRGGRPDLARPILPRVAAPTLLIVGGNDAPVIEMNRSALDDLRCEKHMVIVPGATHLFEEPGALDDVARLARDWFERHLGSARATQGHREAS